MFHLNQGNYTYNKYKLLRDVQHYQKWFMFTVGSVVPYQSTYLHRCLTVCLHVAYTFNDISMMCTLIMSFTVHKECLWLLLIGENAGLCVDRSVQIYCQV